jgi:putative component of toxin-antitoxin plasmid stabilization module
MERNVREIVVYGNSFYEFYEVLDESGKGRVDEVLYLVAHVLRVPVKFLKHIEGHKGLYELRIRSGRNQYRVFCCFGRKRHLVLLNGFRKDSAGTPQREIERAKRLMRQYIYENG